MTPQWITTVGLAMDIGGVFVLFKFGFPQPDFGGGGYLQWGIDKTAPRKRRLYVRMSALGLTLLVGGFGLQLVAAWM